MSITNGDIPRLILKGRLPDNLSEFSLDSQMLSVLMALDGQKSCEAVATQLKLGMDEMRRVLQSLERLALIEQIGGSSAVLDVLDAGFFAKLRQQLSQAMGPIAAILIEDEVSEMGASFDTFPRQMAADLITALARQIPRDEKRIAFQKAMIREIK